MKLILPVVWLILGVAGGVGAGLFLSPPAEEHAAETADQNCAPVQAELHAVTPAHAEVAQTEYVKLNNQFVVPVVHKGKVGAMVVLSLTLEAQSGHKAFIYQHEPKLRDALLQVLFDHSNHGGFDGAFTRGNTINELRAALLETAQHILGTVIRDILILDLARQDT